ncbi:MAG TPA: amidohydrolase [Candidatus Baltobacteraceae bacterium]|nr:amidohydrolase [Candidatus Baltobacteraceae bacterium]
MAIQVEVPSEELVRHRRHIHANPELSMEEFETAAYIERELAGCGFDEIRTGIGKTGILATLKGGRPGPVTLLRADMDGLPVSEEGDVEYRSKHQGVMHACGHDGHVAILLSAARALAKRRGDVKGTLVFCFQPGEEGFAGNQLMIDDGALENPHVDRTFALHLYTGLEVGKIGIRDGAFFASSDRFEAKLLGRGGHGAMPHSSVDPIVAAAQLVIMLQTIASREIAPKDPVVVTVGSVHAGTTFNVIPDNAELRGTVRALDPAVRNSMPERMERITEGLCDAFRLDYEFEYQWGYPPTINDRTVNDVVRDVGREVVGEANVIDPHDIVMWAEDMAFMQMERPGSYFIVGARGLEKGIEPQHSARYDIDERALEIGFKMMVGIGLS